MHENKLMKSKDVAEYIGIANIALVKMVHAGTFPRPDNWPAKRCWVWRKSVVDAWLNNETAPIEDNEKSLNNLSVIESKQPEIEIHRANEQRTPKALPVNAMRLPMQSLGVGDSFVIPDVDAHAARNMVYRQAIKAGIKVQSKTVGSDTHVKRVS